GTDRIFLTRTENGQQAYVIWNEDKGKISVKPAGFSLPPGVLLSDEKTDSGLRLVDLNEDGHPDIVFSNEKEYGVYLFTDMKNGWSRKVIAGKQGEKGALPPIAKNGKNNG